MEGAPQVGPLPDLAAPTPSRHRLILSVALGIAALLVFAAIAVDLRASRHTRAAVSTAAASHPTSKVSGVDDLYLRAVYAYGKRTPASLALAEQYLQQALTKDPSDAPAWSALAITHNLMRQYGAMPASVAFEDARIESQRAIALDPNLADAHASLAFVRFFWDLNAASAEREFHTSVTLDPNSALAHQWFGSMLIHEGRFSEAVTQLNIAQHLDPASTAILSLRALALGFSGHRAEAFDLLQEITSQDPNYPASHYYLSMLNLVTPHDIPRYLAERRSFALLTAHPEDVALVEAMTRAYWPHGRSAQPDEAAMWRLVLREEQKAHPSHPTLLIVRAEANLGATDDAFAALQQLLKHRDKDLLGVVFWPDLSSLHHDPRFNQLLSSMGWPPLS
jgi:Tfp pilus assembly protein PilF